MQTRMRPTCSVCGGRGWILTGVIGKDWPRTCTGCKGKSVEPTIYGVAKLIDVEPKRLYRLENNEAGPKTCAELFPKLLGLLERNERLSRHSRGIVEASP